MPGAPIEPLLAPWDLGCWTGLQLTDIPDLMTWRNDPTYNAHGGESLLVLLERTRTLLTQSQDHPHRLAAITHSAVIRAAVVGVLHAPPEAFWDIDVTPGAITELHGSGPKWRIIRVNASPGTTNPGPQPPTP